MSGERYWPSRLRTHRPEWFRPPPRMFEAWRNRSGLARRANGPRWVDHEQIGHALLRYHEHYRDRSRPHSRNTAAREECSREWKPGGELATGRANCGMVPRSCTADVRWSERVSPERSLRIRNERGGICQRSLRIRDYRVLNYAFVVSDNPLFQLSALLEQ
jgi:hypothetical protein